MTLSQQLPSFAKLTSDIDFNSPQATPAVPVPPRRLLPAPPLLAVNTRPWPEPLAEYTYAPQPPTHKRALSFTLSPLTSTAPTLAPTAPAHSTTSLIPPTHLAQLHDLATNLAHLDHHAPNQADLHLLAEKCRSATQILDSLVASSSSSSPPRKRAGSDPNPRKPKHRPANTTGSTASTNTGKSQTTASPTTTPTCHRCGTTSTPEWRRGPDGARTLCNACGLYHAKLVKRKGEKRAAELVRKRKMGSIELEMPQEELGVREGDASGERERESEKVRVVGMGMGIRV